MSHRRPGTPDPIPGTADGRSTLLAAGAVLATVLAAYHHTLGVPFLMDDVPSIADNPTIRRLGSAWWPPADSGLTVSGRPLLNVSLALNFVISGTEVWSYHLVNLLLHAACGCLLFSILRRTFASARLGRDFGRDSAPLALAAAVLWTAHPLQTESVTYVIQRAESLVAFFYLLTFYCFIRAVAAPRPSAWQTATVLACLAGMASKEVMASAPVLLALYDRIFVSGSWREVWRQRRFLHGATAATWLLLAGLILSSGARGGTVGFDSPITSADYALTQTYAIATYLRLALWPAGLVFDYGVPQAVTLAEIAPEFAAFVLIVLASAIALWRAPAAGFCCLFFFGVLAPTSSVVPVVTQTMTEHRMYLPLAAVVVLVVALLHRLLGRRARWLFAAAALALVAASYQRNTLYRSDLALWTDTAAKRPDNLRAHLNIGLIHYRAGRYPEAADAYARVLALDPNMIEAANNLGNALMKLGRFEDAARHLERAQGGLVGRDRAVALSNLGSVLLQAGRVEEALARLEMAVALAPELPDARLNLGNALLLSGRATDALPHYEAALRGGATEIEVHGNYANALMELGRHAEAIRALEAAVSLHPRSAEAWNNLGVAFAITGRPKEAHARFQRALELDPGFAPARENLARAERALQARP